MKLRTVLLAAVAVLTVVAAPAFAFDQAAAQKLLEDKINSWAKSPEVTNAVKAQNEKNAALTDADVTALDEKWKAGDAAVIDPVLNSALSAYLKKVVAEGGGLYTEIFVMDNKGLNVGQSDKTSDYWQGDEDKWTKTYSAGEGALHLSEVEFDESSQIYQVQLSTTLSDGGAPIGAITVGLNAEELK